MVILASKKYTTLNNISELKFLDFPGILRQNDNTQKDFFWPGMPFVKFDDFCLIPGQLEIMWWVKMLRNLVYNLRTRWFYEWKYNMTYFSKSSHEIPWHFPDICPFSEFPWHFFKFPDKSLTLKKYFFPWLFPDAWQPWTALTSTVEFHSWTLGHCCSGAHQTIGLAAVRVVSLANGRVTSSSVGERRDIVFIMFVFWFAPFSHG